MKKQWCIPKLTPTFLWQMEKILALYQQSYDPLRPVICFDERPCQLIGDVIAPIPLTPGKAKRENYKYKRNGVCNILMAFEPLAGLRLVHIREQRTIKEYAHFMQELAQTHYPHAEQILLIQDNLNTHTPGSFYQILAPDEAFALGERFVINYTPTNGSWLNMVEIELSVIARQCLSRRIADIETLKQEVSVCVKKRNARRAKIQWEFTVNEARNTFHRFYSKLS